MNITTNFIEIKRVLENDEQLHTNKLESLDEMGKFLEIHKLQKPTQEEVENLNRLLTSKGD